MHVEFCENVRPEVPGAPTQSHAGVPVSPPSREPGHLRPADEREGGAPWAGAGRPPAVRGCFLTPSELPDTVSAQVELTVTVTSVNFSEELEDPVSEKYQNFAKEFTRQVGLRQRVPRGYSGLPREGL